MIEALFWLSVALVVHPYLTYPAVMAVAGLLRPRMPRRGEHAPSVTVLIPAFNEAAHIGGTVENKLAQDYPRDRCQILVVSDESTDGTDDVVRSFADRGVELLRQEPRRGKAAGLNAGVKRARGEILVFSDANSLFAPDAVRRLVENFVDPSVGYVTGQLTYRVDDSASARGSDAYMRFENLLRRLESRVHSIIGVNGGVDAMRRSLYADVPEALISDFVLPLQVVESGHRVVFDPRARSTEAANVDLSTEFRMRVRVALRGLQGLVYMRRLLNPLRFPVVAFCLWSHKALRYINVVLLPAAFACGAWLSRRGGLYLALFAAQVACYALAAVGLRERLPGFVRRVTAVPTYFVVTSWAFSLALVKLLRGQTMATWKPRSG